jgi:serine/threonine-protein kinase
MAPGPFPGDEIHLPPQPGTLIEGKYEILTKIREGGMGTIYKVRHRLLDEIRVVKVMRAHLHADEDLRRRFAHEAKTATRLKHPNIVSILDFAIDADGTAYIVMEFIDGVNLLDLLRVSGPPSVPLALEVGRQTLHALAYLHRKNMVHRDIAPDNLMLTHDEDQRPLIKLIDLGIAKDLERTVDMTSTGVFLGKVKYSSPEQLGGLAKGEKIDGRSDIYSMGVVLYELMTGEKPIVGETPRDLLAGHLLTPPRPFEETDPNGRVPEPIRQMVLKALEKSRDKRFATPTEFAQEIDRIQHQMRETPDPDDTRQLLARARDTGPATGENITPSAQSRLDRQFGAATTPAPLLPTGSAPIPTGPSSISASESEPTVAATTSKPRPLPPPASTPPPPRPISAAETVRSQPPTRRGPRPALLILALLGAAIAVLLMLKPGRRETSESTPLPVPTAQSQALPPVAAAPTQAAETSAETAVPEPSPVLEPTPPEAPPTATQDDAVAAAERARQGTDGARRRAERAGAKEKASRVYARAQERESVARRQLSRGQLSEAIPSFAEAERLYRAAEGDARAVTQSQALPTAPAPTIVARVEPTRAPTSPPIPSPVPPTARPAAVALPTQPPAPVVSDEQKIRETLDVYRQAQNTLDAALYARVYPSLSGASRQRIEEAFRNLRSQTLEIDIQAIEITGSTARARIFERRTAVPRIGSEQRDQRSRTVVLEKRGESWLIAGFE